MYWKPVYAYYRQKTGQEADAEDLTQSLFEHLLSSDFFQNTEQVRGKFRDFLKGTARNHAMKHTRARQTRKRGGHVQFISLEELDGGEIVQTKEEPDAVFDRQWALTLLALTLNQLKEECERNGRGELYERLKPVLTGQIEVDAASIAAGLGMTVNALRVAQHRMLKRCREIFRARISQTLPDKSGVDEEMLHLSRALGLRL